MDQGLPLDDEATEAKIKQYLLMSRCMQLKDLQNAHRLIGKKQNQKQLLYITIIILQGVIWVVNNSHCRCNPHEIMWFC